MALRRYLADKFTPSFLMDLCEGLTGFQSDEVVRPFIGEWMRVRGILFQSTPNWAFKTVGVTIELPEEHGLRRDVFLTFTRDLDAVGRVAQGEPIHAEGRIKSISSTQVLLEDCGLTDPAMASIREVSFRADELRRAAQAWKPGEAASELAATDPEPSADSEKSDLPDVDFEHLKLWWAVFSAAYPQHGEDFALASARATFPKHYVRRQWLRDLRGEQPMGRPRKNKDK